MTEPARTQEADREASPELFDFLAERDNQDGDTALGRWNSRKFYGALFDVLWEAGVLHGSVLEIGPGEGIFARQCRAADLSYVAVEGNRNLQQRLRGEGFDVRVGTVPPLPFGDEEHDLVCAMAVLEHMPAFDRALELLQECNRVLKPGGAAVIQVPDALRGGIDFRHWDYSHSFVPTAYRLRRALCDAGFEVDRCVHFTGALTGIVRVPLDILGFLVHSRFAYWAGTSLGLEKWLLRYHKPFEPSFLLVARK